MKLSLYFGRCCTARNLVTVDALLVAVLVTITVMIQLQLHPQLRNHYGIDAFVPLISSHPKQQLWNRQHHRGTTLYANKPQRLDDNVDGVVYVNDRCINCAACAGFASHIFRPSDKYDAHIVQEQPKTISDIVMTRAALAACPVAAIRMESYGERNHNNNIIAIRQTESNNKFETASTNELDTTVTKWTDQDAWTIQQMTSKDMKRPFPRPFLLNEKVEAEQGSMASTVVPDVYWIGHHNEASFGAIPYLVQAEYENHKVWIMVDVPKYNHQSVRDIISITGPNGPHYLFLTHVDDTADHEKWANHFHHSTTNNGGIEQFYCQRIFHAGDLGRYNWIGDTSLEHVPILIPIHPSVSKNVESNNVLIAYTLNGTCISDTNHNWLEQFESGELGTDVLLLHTPGHSPGSCTLYKRRRTITTTSDGVDSVENTIPGVLFTGDTYAYKGNQRMTGFPRYGRNMVQLNHTLTLLITQLQAWDIIAPGHALPRDYRNVSSTVRLHELIEAQNDLFTYRR